ncbi:MAG: TIGR00730 family Rossman fold protein [Nitrospirae bacterium]|nr:MAG: TIGR00730 family Rossman fold protein [Nitrospirota bacterium]
MAKPPVQDDQFRRQFEALLALPDADPQAALLKDLLGSALRLNESRLDMLDFKILHRSLREMRYAFRAFQPYRDRRKVAIFGSARMPADNPVYDLARRFARLVAERGYMVITGAGEGIMRAANEGAGRANSFGVNILLPFEQEPNAAIADDPKLIHFKYFFTRKLFFARESHASVAFPGGFGTHDEVFEILTLLQTGKNNPHPVVLVDLPGGGYWKRWERFVREDMLALNLISPEDLGLFRIVDSAEAAVAEIDGFYRNYHSSRFVKARLVLRLRHPLTPVQVDDLNLRFAHLCPDGKIEQRPALPEEADEPELLALPRLVVPYHRRSAGGLRQLIDVVNALAV